MSEKGNPLDRLTRPGGRPLSDDESIPVLTERLTLPSLDLDISLPKAPPPVAAPPPPPPPPPPPAPVSPPPPPPLRPAAPAASPMRTPAPTAVTRQPPVMPASPPIPTYSLSATVPTAVEAAPEVDWSSLEQKLREAVFRELQPALADEAGRILRERLQPALERVVLATTTELRQAFDSRLREAIARAVATEIARERGRG